MHEVSSSVHSLAGIKAKVVKGQQNRHVSSNMDANSMAQMEAHRVREHQQLKKEKIESFMNSTRLNASKLYKEQCSKNLQHINSKKEILGKQKELKSKYTVIPKKNERIDEVEEVRKLPKEPTQVNWKQAEDACKIIHINVQNCEVADSESDAESGYDSEIDRENNETPEQVSTLRMKIRKQMLQKFKKP